MSWTDERIALLTDMWEENKLSASQIANELGGVSRNAVIGKANRLNIARGVKIKRAVTQKSVSSKPKKVTRTTVKKGSGRTGKKIKTANGIIKNIIPVADLPTNSVKPNEVDILAPEPLHLKLKDLNGNTCAWPLGDPMESDYSYCGHSTEKKTDRPGKYPYCGYHCKLAYHPVANKRRRLRHHGTPPSENVPSKHQTNEHAY